LAPPRKKSRGVTVGPMPTPKDDSVTVVETRRMSLFGVAMRLREKFGMSGRGPGLEMSSIEEEGIDAVNGSVDSLRLRSGG
jgi:hypothetical protein